MLISKATFLDYQKITDYKEFFKDISVSISEKIQLDSSQIYELLLDREKESTTLLKEGLAIPHLVIPREKKFEIFVIRSLEGIDFNGKKANTIFILAGTKDERNFHLKTLMSIAQIVSSVNFEKEWKVARNLDDLKNIILLSNRVREGRE